MPLPFITHGVESAVVKLVQQEQCCLQVVVEECLLAVDTDLECRVIEFIERAAARIVWMVTEYEDESGTHRAARLGKMHTPPSRGARRAGQGLIGLEVRVSRRGRSRLTSPRLHPCRRPPPPT
jgi:hypothetical protein